MVCMQLRILSAYIFKELYFEYLYSSYLNVKQMSFNVV